MKPRRGTPIKFNNVGELKKSFEPNISGDTDSSPTRGFVELLPQLCKGVQPTNPNLQTTTRCARLESRYCVSQPEGGGDTDWS